MEPYGSVNLGMTILEGKQRPDPNNWGLNLGKEPTYGRGEDVELRKQNVYMGGQNANTGAVQEGVQDPKLYYDKREKKDSIRRKIMDNKMVFAQGRASQKDR